MPSFHIIGQKKKKKSKPILLLGKCIFDAAMFFVYYFPFPHNKYSLPNMLYIVVIVMLGLSFVLLIQRSGVIFLFYRKKLEINQAFGNLPPEAHFRLIHNCPFYPPPHQFTYLFRLTVYYNFNLYKADCFSWRFILYCYRVLHFLTDIVADNVAKNINPLF